MSALRRAWETEHGAGSMVGLAPSAMAAQALADDPGIATENTAKWWTNHQHTGATFQPSQFIIIDEAPLAGTLSLNRITQAAEEAGAKVLLVGDAADVELLDQPARGRAGLVGSDQLVDFSVREKSLSHPT
ncbi:AAA family ATPase [Tessaracoccus sp. OH4464_COT-324]|uniref:AAA family ATPase n=1 Tax=Tessaracoccus sp. OH4464_COT-324 TaxID=2491059 RepID=UPI001F29D8B0|nr:AAA family ATPase [Tessaracoccus sp. OH4464_COT-324]